MDQLATPGPDGNAGAMGGNSGGGDNATGNPAHLEISFGPGGWRSPALSGGARVIDQRNS